MKEFFKPTKAKILLTVLLLFIEFIASYFISAYNTGQPDSSCFPSLSPKGYPSLSPTPDPYQNPHSLPDLVNALLDSDVPNPCGYVTPGIDSPIIKTLHFTQIIFIYTLLPYSLSCILVAVVGKLKKRNKISTAKSKK